MCLNLSAPLSFATLSRPSGDGGLDNLNRLNLILDHRIDSGVHDLWPDRLCSELRNTQISSAIHARLTCTTLPPTSGQIGFDGMVSCFSFAASLQFKIRRLHTPYYSTAASSPWTLENPSAKLEVSSEHNGIHRHSTLAAGHPHPMGRFHQLRWQTSPNYSIRLMQTTRNYHFRKHHQAETLLNCIPLCFANGSFGSLFLV